MFATETQKEIQLGSAFLTEAGKYVELGPVFLTEGGKYVELLGGGISRLVLFSGANTSSSYRPKYSDDCGETWVSAGDANVASYKAVSSGEVIDFVTVGSSSSYRNIGYTLDGEVFTLNVRTALRNGFITYIPETKVFVYTYSYSSSTYVYYSSDGKTWANSMNLSSFRWAAHSPMIYDAVNKCYMVAANGDICNGGSTYPPFKSSYTNSYDCASNSDWQVREEGGLATHEGLTVAQVHMSGLGTSAAVIYSLDAKTWTRCNFGSNDSTNMYCIRYIRDRFIAFCEDESGAKYIKYTFDGKTWTNGGSYETKPAIDSEIIDLGDELIYANGLKIYHTVDGGLSWAIKTTFVASTDKISGIVMSYLE